jgi:hypothetical protein
MQTVDLRYFCFPQSLRALVLTLALLIERKPFRKKLNVVSFSLGSFNFKSNNYNSADINRYFSYLNAL